MRCLPEEEEKAVPAEAGPDEVRVHPRGCQQAEAKVEVVVRNSDRHTWKLHILGLVEQAQEMLHLHHRRVDLHVHQAGDARQPLEPLLIRHPRDALGNLLEARHLVQQFLQLYDA